MCFYVFRPPPTAVGPSPEEMAEKRQAAIRAEEHKREKEMERERQIKQRLLAQQQKEVSHACRIFLAVELGTEHLLSFLSLFSHSLFSPLSYLLPFVV